MSPTIFNVVVDVGVCHWIYGIVDETAERGETGKEGPHQSAVLYDNNGMVVSLDPAWLQGAFSALVAIFDRVELTEAGYSRRLTGVGKTYTEWQRERVACGECGTVIADGSMSSHMMT